MSFSSLICRLCLLESNSNVSLFNSSRYDEARNDYLSHKVMQIANVQVRFTGYLGLLPKFILRVQEMYLNWTFRIGLDTTIELLSWVSSLYNWVKICQMPHCRYIIRVAAGQVRFVYVFIRSSSLSQRMQH